MADFPTSHEDNKRDEGCGERVSTKDVSALSRPIVLNNLIPLPSSFCLISAEERGRGGCWDIDLSLRSKNRYHRSLPACSFHSVSFFVSFRCVHPERPDGFSLNRSSPLRPRNSCPSSSSFSSLFSPPSLPSRFCPLPPPAHPSPSPSPPDDRERRSP